MNQDKVTTREREREKKKEKKRARIKCNEGKFKLKVCSCKGDVRISFKNVLPLFLRFNFRALHKDIKRFSATSNANICTSFEKNDDCLCILDPARFP